MTTETTTIQKAIELANSGQKVPVMELVRRNPDMAAVISKLHRGTIPPNYDNQGNQRQMHPDMQRMRTVSARAAQSIQDSETIMQTLPDIELSSQILVSSVLSPSDLNKPELTYHAPEGLIAPQVSASMLDIISNHFDNVYKIKTQLPTMLRSVLFTEGSYIAAVIPENSIDEAINGTRRLGLESLSQSIDRNGEIINRGLLGPAVKSQPVAQRGFGGISMESFDDTRVPTGIQHRVTLESWGDNVPLDTMLTVVDNPDVLKIPQIQHKLRETKIASVVKAGMALESLTETPPNGVRKLSDRELSSLVFKDPSFSYEPITALKTQEQLSRKTVGNPLVMRLPAESVVPVHVPGNYSEHIGYFVLLDMDGNPVTRTESTDYYEQLSNRMSSGDNFASTMLNKVKTQMQGFNYTNKMHLEMSSRMYGEAIEQDLIARLRNGVYGNGVALAKNEEIYRIMLSRALQKKQTQLLFLPVELVTYFAFRYSQDGIGVSMLEEMKILSSLRTMMLFSNVMAAVRNSIGRTEVKIKLDEDDPDPDKTIETVMHEVQKTRHAAFPIGVSNPVDMVDWMGRAGFEFIPEGHPGIPDVRVDFGEKATNYPKPDTDLEDSLRKRQIMGFGLSPESVDAGFNAEFATSIVNNNLLLSKRVTQIQDQFCKPLSEHHRKIIMNSEATLKRLYEVLKNNYADLRSPFKDNVEKALQAADGGAKIEESAIQHYVVGELLRQFVRGLTVTLPAPSTVTLRNQIDEYKEYKEGLNEAIGDYIDANFMTQDLVGDVANQVEAFKAAATAYFGRKFMAERGIFTELADLVTLDENGKPIMNLQDATLKHAKAMALTLTATVIAAQPQKNGLNQVIQDKTGGLDGSTSSPDTSSTDDGSGGNDDGLGLDDNPGGSGNDFNFDLDTPPDGAPAEAPLEDEESQPATDDDKAKKEGGDTPPAE